MTPAIACAPPHTLEALLDERGPLRAAEAIRILHRLLAEVRALHGAGRLHRGINLESVHLDDDGQIVLADPPEQVEVGGADADLEVCPPELREAPAVRVAEDLAAARRALEQVGLTLDPRRIDVYQLGALFARLLTGQPATAYLRSVKVKAQVPLALQPLLERALGFTDAERFNDADAFASALADLAPREAVETPPHGSENPVASATPSASETPGPPPMPRSTQLAPDRPFDRLGHYQVLRKIGHGGMGDVYLGFEEALQRQVAIKVLPAELARNDDFVRRFLAEAAAVARLSHLHIVPVYYIGHEDGHHFYVMQYVEGESLDRLLERRKRLNADETIAILQQCLAGLAEAHRAGLVHRDVKPGNVLLDTKAQRALIADFGLVKSGGNGLTATGVVLGTVDYMAPEVVRGLKADARADLYALGVMAYQMLSGRLPFVAESASVVLFQHAYEAPRPLRQAAPDVPAPLAALVERLMEKDPRDRYPSCAEVLADLARVRAGEPLSAAPRSSARPALERSSRVIPLPDFGRLPELPAGLAATQGGRWQRLRDRVGTWLFANSPEIVRNLQGTVQQVDGAVAAYERRRERLASLLAEARGVADELTAQAELHREVTATAASRVAAATDPEASDRATREKEDCERTTRELDTLAAEQREQLSQMEMQLAQVDTKLGGLRSQRDLLNARLRAAQALGGTDGKPRHARRRWVAAAILSAVLVAGMTWFFARGPRSATPQLTSPASYAKSHIAIAVQRLPQSPAGASLSPVTLVTQPATISGLRGWTLETYGHRGVVDAVAHSPDGRWIASGSQDGTIRIWDAKKHKLARVLLGQGGCVHALAWSPKPGRLQPEGNLNIFRIPPKFDLLGPILASGGTDGTVCLWAADTGLKLRTMQGHTDAVTSVGWSPDGAALASASLDKTARVWDVKTGQTQTTVSLPDGGANALCWSPRGSMFATGGPASTIQVWSSTGAAVRKWQTTLPTQRIAWSPDGQTMATVHTDSAIRLWDPRAGTLRQQLSGSQQVLRDVAWSPDGTKLAAGGEDHIVRVWDAEIGTVLGATGRIHTNQVGALCWSPDGRTITSGGWEGAVRFWDAGTLQPLGATPGFLQTAWGVSWSPNGRTIAVGCWDNSVRLWDATTGRLLHTLRGHAGGVISVAWSPNGSMLAAGDWAGVVRLWDGATGQPLRSITGPRGYVEALAWSPDGRKLAVGGPGDNFVRVYLAATGERTFTHTGHDGPVAGIAWSPDGKLLASSGHDHRVCVWNDGSAAPLHVHENAGGDNLAWSPNGQRLALGDWYGSVHVWTSGGAKVKQLDQSKGTVAVQWLASGDSLAAMGCDRELWMCETKNWTRQRSVPVPAGGFLYKSDGMGTFSPDGRVVATGHINGLYLWESETGRPLGTLASLADGQSIAVSADGNYRGTPQADQQLIYVIETDQGQEVLSSGEFAARYGWKNDPVLKGLTSAAVQPPFPPVDPK